MPKVSVLMPVYNGSLYLSQAIESILNQTFTDFEFLIIDDGSTDESVSIITSYRDSRIRLIQNDVNYGLTYSLNRGLSFAQGEYIARMDCDDISLPDRLIRQVNFLEEHPEIGILGTLAQIVDGNNNLFDVINLPQNNFEIKWNLCFYCPFIHPTIVIRTKIIQEVNGYTSEIICGREIFSGEDYDLWRRASRITQLANLSNVLLYLRKHDANVTKIYLDEHIKNAIYINQRCIEDVIHEKTEYSTVYNTFCQNVKNIDELNKANDLIIKIHQRFIKKQKIPKKILTKVNNDACNRILNLANPYINSKLMIRLYWTGAKINLLLFFKLFLKSLLKKIKFFR